MAEATRQVPRSMTPTDALAHARRAYAAGNFKEAASVAGQVRAGDPQNANAITLLAAAHAGLSDFPLAVDATKAAIALHPRNAVMHANLCEILRRSGDLEGAIAAGLNAVAINGQNATALSNLGIALYENGDLEGAETYQRRALAKDPKFARALNNIGSILRDRKESEEALEYYKRAHQAEPADDEIISNLGNVYVEANMDNEAIELLTARVKRGKAPAETYGALGRAFLALDRLDDAERSFRSAIALDRENIGVILGLARTIQNKNQAQIALQVVDEAMKLDAEHPAVHHLRGALLGEMNRPDEARASYLKALELDAEFLPAIVSLGYHYTEIGEKDNARAQFEKAIINDERDFAGHLGIARLEKMTEDHPTLKRLEERAKEVDDMPARRAISLHYALGKGYDDINRYDDSFHHYTRGAALKRGTIRHDPSVFTGVVDRVIETFTPERIARLRESAIPLDRSIFVLGMPRSGTTLTETIIASHPDVFGGGELRDWHRLLPTEVGPVERRYPGVMASGDVEAIHEIAQQYDDSVAAMAGKHPRITDKMPANFIFLGVIHALLPNARIVHTVRDPVDTCLSCLTRLFDKAQYHSYDQVELGTYYNNYRRVMNHWRSVLPEGAFYDSRYEELVEDFEPNARRLIDWCGLAWDDACLTPHKTKRSVRTASVTQVREPIYTSSVQKWKPYEKHLQPLIKTLGDNVTV